MRDKNSFRQRYKYWKETGELPYSNGLKRDLDNQVLAEDSPVKSGIPYPKYDGGKDGLFVKYVDSYRVNPDTGGVYDKVGEIKEGAVILPEVEVVGKPTGIEAMRREYGRISDIQRRQGLSGADPIGLFAVETAALNPVFKLAGTAGLYGLGRYGESLTGFARPQNWARAKLIAREMLPLLRYKGLLAARIIGDEYSSDSFFNPNSYYHVENNPLNRSKFPILTPRGSQSPAIWLLKGRPWLGDNSRTIYELPGSSFVRSSSEIDNEFANYFLSDKIDLTDPQLTAYKQIRGLRPGESWLGRMKYYTPTLQRNIRSIEWPTGRTTQQITAENAARMTPEQWTAVQDAAIARGDMTEAQRLRDLHFKVSAPNTKMIDMEGMPIHNYHGSSEGINIFYNPIEDPNYYRHGRLSYGTSSKNRKGIYFSDDKDVAKQYKTLKNGKIYDVYLNFEKPYSQSYKETSKQLWYNILHPFNQKYRLDPGNIRPKDFDFLSSYDSVIHTDAENIALKSNQIKLADAVTYDDNGVRIPLGERDNFKLNNIRYGWLAPFIGLGTLGTVHGTFNRR